MNYLKISLLHRLLRDARGQPVIDRGCSQGSYRAQLVTDGGKQA